MWVNRLACALLVGLVICGRARATLPVGEEEGGDGFGDGYDDVHWSRYEKIFGGSPFLKNDPMENFPYDFSLLGDGENRLLRSRFRQHDLDQNGVLDGPELERAMRRALLKKLGPSDPTEASLIFEGHLKYLVYEVMQEDDVDKDGQLSFAEFANLHKGKNERIARTLEL